MIRRNDNFDDLTDDDGHAITEYVFQRLRYVKVISFGAYDRLLLKLDNEDILKMTCSAPWNFSEDFPEFFEMFKKVWPTMETILSHAYAWKDIIWFDVYPYRQRIDGPLSKFIALPSQEGFCVSDPNAPWSHQLGDMTTPRDFKAPAEETTLTRVPDDDDDEDEDEDEDEKLRHQVKKQCRKKELGFQHQVETLIVHHSQYDGLTWENMFGQAHAVDAVRLIVDAIKGNFKTKPHNAVLLHGPSGTGKDQLAMVAASELEATLFNVPVGFGSRKPDIWKVLFDVATKRSPAIIFFNECDGILNSSAVPALKQIEWTKQNAPFIIGATNHHLQLDAAIANRFGPSIAFTHFDDEMRKAIVKRMQAPSDFASDDADWDELLQYIQGMDGRAIEQLCKTVAARVERECVEAGRELRNVTLEDFKAHVSKSPQVDKSGLPEDFITTASTEIRFHYEACPSYAPCVNLRHLLFMFVPATLVTMGLPYDQLRKSWQVQLEHKALSLKALSTNLSSNRGRSDNTRLPPAFLKNLLTVMERAFPETWGDFFPNDFQASKRVVRYIDKTSEAGGDQERMCKYFENLSPKSARANEWMDSSFLPGRGFLPGRP